MGSDWSAPQKPLCLACPVEFSEFEETTRDKAWPFSNNFHLWWMSRPFSKGPCVSPRICRTQFKPKQLEWLAANPIMISWHLSTPRKTSHHQRCFPLSQPRVYFTWARLGFFFFFLRKIKKKNEEKWKPPGGCLSGAKWLEHLCVIAGAIKPASMSGGGSRGMECTAGSWESKGIHQGWPQRSVF